jgi:hypothetical protein
VIDLEKSSGDGAKKTPSKANAALGISSAGKISKPSTWFWNLGTGFFDLQLRSRVTAVGKDFRTLGALDL